MAAFYVTVDGACKGKAEDIAVMKTRLSALLNNQDKLDNPDWLRELFGEEINELVDLDDEDSISEKFGGFRIDWGDNRIGDGFVDTDNLQFGGEPAEERNQSGGVEVARFLEAIKNVFPRVEFHFISWCYISSGVYFIFVEGEEDLEEYEWFEYQNGEEKKDAYIAWRLAYRDLWFLDDAATDAERAAAEAAVEDAEVAFKLRILPSGDEDADEEEKSYDDWLTAVGENGWELGRAPEEMRTVELCAKAFSVGESGLILRFVPETMRPQVCLAAVQQNGRALYFVPESLKTAPDLGSALCLAAVQQNGWVLSSVPESLKTAPDLGSAICLAAVQQDGYVLQSMPECLKTAEICLAAVQQNGDALKYVPEAMQEQVKLAAGIE